MKIQAKTADATNGGHKKKQDMLTRPGSLSAIVAGAKAPRKKGLLEAIKVYK